MSRHNLLRRTTRRTLRRTFRNCNRSCLRGRRRGPDDFAQMLTAYGRALRAHRKLARLAPQFFDAAVVARERENRAEQRRWMEFWEPHIAKAYGVEPKPVTDRIVWPQLPPLRIQQAVDRQLAEVSLWLAAAHAAGERHRQRRPHALPSWSRLARLLDLAFDHKKFVLGLDSPNPLPMKITYDYEFTNLKRGYGHLCDAAAAAAAPAIPPAGPAPVPAAPTASASPAPMVCPPAPSPPSIPGSVPANHRCDAWSRWARQMRRRTG